MTVTPNDVLTFWQEAGPQNWFKKDDAFDADILSRFGETLDAAERGRLNVWADAPEGALALIIVLDQFSRNLHRDSAKAFANDDAALALTQRLMITGDDRKLTAPLHVFAYMPMMHAEKIEEQERCIAEMFRLRLMKNHEFAIIHRDIIKRFGRFPHRNALLGRTTTREEQEFLDSGGFSG